MNKVILVLLILLIVLVFVLLGSYGGMIYKNQEALTNTQLKTFLMYVSDGLGMGSGDSSWVSTDPTTGIEPISCPAGMKVNIVDAVFEPFDPYSQMADPTKCLGGSQLCYPKGDPSKGEYSGTASQSNYYGRIQDATPYLISQCNGKESCKIEGTDFNLAFGNPPVTNVTPLNIDQALPPITDTSNPERFYVHGVYTCVL